MYYLHYFWAIEWMIGWGIVFFLRRPVLAPMPQIWQRHRQKAYCVLAVFPLLILSGFRSVRLGTDTLWYAGQYLRGWKDVTWKSIGSAVLHGFESVDSCEPGYAALSKLLCTVTGGNYQILLCVVALCFFVPLCIFICENSKMPCFSFVLFTCMLGEVFVTTAMRQSMATGFACLLGYRYLRQKRFWPFLVCVLVGASFHKSCLILLVFYFVARFPIKKWYVALALGAYPVIFLLKGRLIYLATLAGYGEYIEESGGSGYAFIAAYLLLTLVAVWRRKPILEANPDAAIYYNALFIGLELTPFTLINVSIMRIIYYFSLFLLLLLPEIIASFPKKEQIVVYGGGMASLILLLAQNKPFHIFFWQG